MSRTVGWSWVRSVRWSLVVVLMVTTVLSVPSAARAADGTCSVGGGGASHATIQAAVNDAGCATINVAAGTYQENVTISRAVTISGAGADSTMVDGGGRTCATRERCTVFHITQPVAVTFDGVTIRNGYHGNGQAGGINIPVSANVTVQNSIVANNAAGNYAGGGIFTSGDSSGMLTIRNSVFSGNTAGGGGAAIRNLDSGLAVLNSTFSGNQTGNFGIVSTSGPTTITNSTFAGNSSYSGALYSNDLHNTATVINSTFTNNHGQLGGAITADGPLNVSSSTIAGNSASVIGGGIYNRSNTVTLKSTILANNAGGNCSTNPGYITTDGGNNLRWPSTDGSCFGTFGDPKLAALADNGGATQTMAVQVGSAAIDAGACTDTRGATIPTDQRGTARPLGLTCDSGAFESAFTAGLIGHWTFDEGTGLVIQDSSGYGRTGSLMNGATFTNAAPLPALSVANPFALSLTGSARQYVNVGTNLMLANTSFTVATWAKRSNSAGKQWILSQGTQNTDRALVLGFRDNDRFTCAFYDDDLDTSKAYADTGVWHHWACTWDAATRARTIYRDGVQVASDRSSGRLQASGAFNLGRATWNEAYFSGALDDMRVYNRTLSASEVQALVAGKP